MRLLPAGGRTGAARLTAVGAQPGPRWGIMALTTLQAKLEPFTRSNRSEYMACLGTIDFEGSTRVLSDRVKPPPTTTADPAHTIQGTFEELVSA